MRKWLYGIFFLSAVALVGHLIGQECKDQKKFWDYHPLHVGGNLIFLGKAGVDVRGGPRTGDLTFNKENLYTYFLLPVNECTFFLPRIEWNTFTMDWDKNPRFHSKHFHYVQFALGFFTEGLENWEWIARINYNIDSEHFNHPKTYGLFEALLWGVHELAEKWHYHIGACGYTGFRGQEIYPIIGLDYELNKKWFFQAVFPITYSVEYSFNNRWSLSLKGRPLKERFRSGGHEPSPRSVFSYSTMGAELNLRYEKFLRLEFELFGGYNFGGDFYIKDNTGHNSLYTHLKGAPYVGASLNWGI